jgi:hypothetical protein
MLFSLPLSLQASSQLTELQELLQERDWDNNTCDCWVYNWGPSKYTSKKGYSFLQASVDASPLFSWLWSSSNLGKRKFFFWLLLRDRLSTRNILKRKKMHLDDYNCALCTSNCEETSFHLFFECPFSKSWWQSLAIDWNLQLPPLDMVIEARNSFGTCIFREIVITSCWIIWTTKNRAIFDGESFTLAKWLHDFKSELGLVCIKAKPSVKLLLESWLENIP